MSQGFVCDSLLFVFDIFQQMLNFGFLIFNQFGIPTPDLRQLLGGGSLFGCNL